MKQQIIHTLALHPLSPQGIWLALGSFVIALVLLAWWLLRVQTRINNKFSALARQWDKTIECSDLNPVWLTPAAAFAESCPKFVESTKVAADKLLPAWASWIAARSLAITLSERHKRYIIASADRPVWKFFFTLRSGVDMLTTDDHAVSLESLPPSVRASLGSAVIARTFKGSELLEFVRAEKAAIDKQVALFNAAMKAASEAGIRIDNEFSSAQSNPLENGLNQLSDRIVQVGLPFAPYQATRAEIDQNMARFKEVIATDPLLDHNALETTLRVSIQLLRSQLIRALQLKAKLEALTVRGATLNKRVLQMRAVVVVSALPAVTFDSAYRLDESGYTVAEPLGTCLQSIIELDSALVRGDLDAFENVYSTALAGLEALEAMISQIDFDKSRVETETATIVAQSTDTDTSYDGDDRNKIKRLYQEQRWHAARVAVDALSIRNAHRQSARADVARLESALADLAATITTQPEIVSAEIEKLLQARREEIASLRAESQLGLIDWEGWNEKMAAANARLTGSELDSLNSRLQAELASYNQFASALAKVVETLSDLRAKVADKWGGTEAEAELAKASPSVDQLLVAGRKHKADWQALVVQAQEVLVLLQPAHKLVYTEVMRERELRDLLNECQRNITQRPVEDESYIRNVCGIKFGVGIYCATAQFSEPLNRVGVVLDRRDYAGTELELMPLWLALHKEHLECTWLLLQMMAHSGEACAAKFAKQCGYADGMFELWAQARMQECPRSPYLLPPFESSKHDAKSSLFLVATTDAPTISDYEPATKK